LLRKQRYEDVFVRVFVHFFGIFGKLDARRVNLSPSYPTLVRDAIDGSSFHERALERELNEWKVAKLRRKSASVRFSRGSLDFEHNLVRGIHDVKRKAKRVPRAAR
jgi:hypothetical protein